MEENFKKDFENKSFDVKLLNDNVVVTTALPYANGELHLGHFLEYIQADVFVRSLRKFNNNVFFISASDMHGTPIELNALKSNVDPESFAKSFWNKHKSLFEKFNISFDEFYYTHSEENKKLAEYFFEKLKDKNLIYSKNVEQLYCEYDKRFLPDRFVKGKCPYCGAENQYGDVCEVCGKTYKAEDLIDPYCVLCKNKPVKKSSKHYFFKLSSLSDELKEFILNSDFQEESKNYVLSWINTGLKDWDISRDGPYFGFKIPGEENKFFYVWLDAPIGYISSLQHFLNKNLEDTKKFWNDSFIIHFIGKDIMYFHFLFWTAMLKNVGFKTPDKIHVHGFLNINKEKMSKSRGTFITASSIIEEFPSDIIRFYLSYLLNDKIEDVNFSKKDLVSKVNHELISNVMNFHYRILSLLKKKLSDNTLNFESLFKNISDEDNVVFKNILEELFFLNYDFFYNILNLKHNLAVKSFLKSGDVINKFIQSRMPWKEEDNSLTLALSYFFGVLNLNMLSVLMPSSYNELLKQYSFNDSFFEEFNVFLKEKGFDFDKIVSLFLKYKSSLNEVFPNIIFKKFKEEDEKQEEKKVKNKINEGKKSSEQKTNEQKSSVENNTNFFDNVLLKSALIVNVEKHPNADKLYVLKLKVPCDKDFEDCDFEERTIVSGLVDFFSMEELLNKKIVLVYNLKPAVLRKVKSEGMLLAASKIVDGKEVLSLLEPLEDGYIFGEDNIFSKQKVLELKNRFCSIDDVLNSNLVVKDNKVLSPYGFLKTKNSYVKANISDGSRVR